MKLPLHHLTTAFVLIIGTACTTTHTPPAKKTVTIHVHGKSTRTISSRSLMSESKARQAIRDVAFTGYPQDITGGTISLVYEVTNPTSPTQAVIYAPELADNLIVLDKNKPNASFVATKSQELLIQMRPVPYNGNVWANDHVETLPSSGGVSAWKWVFPPANLTIKQTPGLPPPPPPSPKITRLTYSFHTTDNDKDWNTQPGAQIYFQGHIVAERFCCSSDKPDDHHDGDHWKNNTDSPVMDLPISDHITKDQLSKATYHVSSRASGNDDWHFDARLHAEFSDGSHLDWTFMTIDLDSRHNSLESKDLALISQ